MSPQISARLKAIKYTYIAIVAGPAIFTLVVYFLLKQSPVADPDYDFAIVLQSVAILFVPASMAAGYFLFKPLVNKIDPTLSLETRLLRYNTLTIVRGALFEVGFMFCSVCALITGIELFLYITPVIFLVMLLLRPTPEGIAQDLKLNDREQRDILQQ